ncbi:outer membrane channel lipoprotein [Gluconacetobacter sacchari DSM 12717]|uniref:Efflux transporter outer membrane subunit n=2 Tax=Gluconacetobacter sacchari TaxID=92759 RepID=A0A7W4NM02_9PROT|nr:efflux transporter outer membrane subunit [Gluconacetobacter sacchari]MBB2160242.1 efflux transporter outer membrane subunit [Gluconacetobacter sacchari]GBQ28609.1 outer membrane channel lipoprotein [Gluconacetobacter sacchari DSM 12717]
MTAAPARPVSPRRWRHLLCGAGMLSVLIDVGGCAVGPNFHHPAAPATRFAQAGRPARTDSLAGADGQAQVFHPGADIPAEWWTLFHSPALDRLVRHALANSPTLDSARHALRVAQENRAAQAGVLYPSISASFNPARYKTSRTYSPVPNSNSWLYTVHTAQLNISYQADIWGGLRRGIEATSAQRDAERYQLEAAYLSLTGELVQAAIAYAALRAQVEATQDLVASQREILDSATRQIALGQISDADLAQQRAQLAQAEATLVPLRQQVTQQHDQIAALAGDMPDDPTPDFTLDGFTLPQDLPVSVPARLIDQRPDVKVAEAGWHAACAQVGVAIANRLPNLQLSAQPGLAAASIGQLFVPGYGQWMVAGMLSQPLFQGGQLMHQERAARAQYEQAAADYRAAVVAAVQDVTDSLNAIGFDATALVADSTAERAATRGLEIARARLAYGDASRVDMLLAAQTALQARVTLAQARAARLSDTAGLFQSLGGGWWNRHDAPPARAGWPP